MNADSDRMRSRPDLMLVARRELAVRIWVTLLSLLRPTAPILMPLRTSLVSVPAWQVIIAVLFALAAIYGLFRIGARLYRNAILHTGARLHLREAWRGQPGPQPTSGSLGRTAA